MQRRALEEKVLTIKRLISNNQTEAAKEYALKNNLTELYHKQLTSFAAGKTEAEKQGAERDNQQKLNLQQQAVAVQQQQLQNQQMALEKTKAEQQQQINNQIYYGPVPVPQKNPCQSLNCTVTVPPKPVQPSQFRSEGMMLPQPLPSK